MASGRLGMLVNLSRDELSWYGGERYATRNRLSGIGLCGTHASAFAIDAFQPHMMGVQFGPAARSRSSAARRAISRTRMSRFATCGARKRPACTSASSRRRRPRAR